MFIEPFSIFPFLEALVQFYYEFLTKGDKEAYK